MNTAITIAKLKEIGDGEWDEVIHGRTLQERNDWMKKYYRFNDSKAIAFITMVLSTRKINQQ